MESQVTGTHEKSHALRLAKPVVGPRARQWIEQIISSGRLIQGPFCERFEEALGNIVSSAHAIAMNSGTSALYACLKACDIGPGMRVGISDLGFAATINAVELAGARPVFLDVEEETLDISLKCIEDTGPGLDALIVVHQLGLPAGRGIFHKAHDDKVMIVEDAACGLGSKLGSRSCGTLGIAGTFSFHPRKIVTTGEGGAIVTDNEHIARRAMAFRNHGFSGNEKNDIIEPGMNLRLSEISCAIGLEQLENLESTLEKRRSLLAVYKAMLDRVPGIRILSNNENDTWNVQTLAIMFEDSRDRDRAMTILNADQIEANPPVASLSAIPYYAKKYKIPLRQVETSRKCTSLILAIPCYEGMDESDIERVCMVLKSCF
ncbi:MAG: DegT/DnrJ/EryC1/StrS family aminotransferase [Deltaproteobacteria bacterium]|nr:DegT/DnrJ/EryC1/StrS family aminotransferase [Deltaproteobacteria bacterium]